VSVRLRFAHGDTAIKAFQSVHIPSSVSGYARCTSGCLVSCRIRSSTRTDMSFGPARGGAPCRLTGRKHNHYLLRPKERGAPGIPASAPDHSGAFSARVLQCDIAQSRIGMPGRNVMTSSPFGMAALCRRTRKSQSRVGRDTHTRPRLSPQSERAHPKFVQSSVGVIGRLVNVWGRQQGLRETCVLQAHIGTG